MGHRGHHAYRAPYDPTRPEGDPHILVRLLIDTNVLGKICHPRKYQDVRAWLRLAAMRHELLLSELADYELRRELLRINSRRGIASR